MSSEAKFLLKFHPVFDFPKRWLFLYSTKRLEYVETLLIECIPKQNHTEVNDIYLEKGMALRHEVLD